MSNIFRNAGQIPNFLKPFKIIVKVKPIFLIWFLVIIFFSHLGIILSFRIYKKELIFQELLIKNLQQGNLYALSGNMNALKKGMRFEKVDLNRIWTHEHVQYIQTNADSFSSDVNEKIALYKIVKKLLYTEKGPFYFIDLHSTSAKTNPFITISDSINNRKFSSKFPVPIILGIEEYLEGPFLSFINEFGHIALGFEAGQHNDIQAVKCSKAFI